MLLLTLRYSIILVPGTGTASPDKWPFVDQTWLATLPRSGAGARILTYVYASPFAGTRHSWESILMLGYDLLHRLHEARSPLNPSLVSETAQKMIFECLFSDET